MTDDAQPARALVEWFRAAARELPWRTTPRDPYAVLVSELMLQQTQVDRVVPKFVAFVRRFPDVAVLAAAEEAEVLEAWSGLGYYRRARFLHAAAKAVVEGGGEFPSDLVGLRALPGVGPYTAAAVASLAFGASAPVLDGNVIRVAARVLTYPGDPRSAAGSRELRGWVADALLAHHGQPGEINEALMELGATVCRPRDPACLLCPLRAHCQARVEDRQEDFPPPKKGGRAVEQHRWIAAIAVDGDGRWALREVTEGPILRGLWLPPLDRRAGVGDVIERARALLPGLSDVEARRLEPVVHGITFRRITVVPVIFEVEPKTLEEGATWHLARPDAPGRPTSSLLTKLAAALAAAEETSS